MRFLFVFSFFFASAAQAALPDCLSEGAFRALASELAPKVNLFAEVWRQDPAAEFYGGTTRDYLYWVKGRFQNCKNAEDAARITSELRAERVIDVRDFIIGDSDVDIVSEKPLSLDRDRYGVKKIDTLSPEIFDDASEKGRNELVQGFIPAEKVRLGADGLRPPAKFGDGLSEIYSGRVTVHFTAPEVFATGHYAKEGINHPILLALRYERLLGINYFKSHGAGLPDKAKLFDIDPASEAAVRKVIAEASRKEALAPFFAKEQFKKWFNGAIQKSFRSYTNPTAAFDLMKHFGVDQLARRYEAIEPLNQYLFQRYRDDAAVKKNLAQLGVNERKLYIPIAERFPDGHLYHGTRTEDAFRGILLQGFLPSESGSGGAGLYGVPVTNKAFAIDWGNSADRLIKIPIKPGAKLVDVTEGEGKRAWDAFQKGVGADEEAFADFVGADLVRYPYHSEAYVVKNSSELGRPEGVTRKILTLSEAKRAATEIKDVPDLLRFADSVFLNHFPSAELEDLFESVPPTVRARINAADVEPEDVRKLFAWISEHGGDLTREGGQTGIAKLVVGLLDERPVWMPNLVSSIKDVNDFHFWRNLWPEGWSGLSPAEAIDAIGQLRSAGIPIFTGPFRDAKDLNQLPAFGSRDSFSGAIRDLARPDAMRTLRELKTLQEIESTLYGSSPVTALLREQEYPELIEAWRNNGALAELLAPVRDGADLTRRFPRGEIGPLRLRAYQEGTPRVLEYLRTVDPKELEVAFLSYVIQSLNLLFNDADAQTAVKILSDRGAIAAMAKRVKKPEDLPPIWATMESGEGAFAKELRDAVYAQVSIRAHELWDGRSMLAEMVNNTEHREASLMADAFLHGYTLPGVRAVLKESQKDVTLFARNAKGVGDYLSNAPWARADRALAEALLKETNRNGQYAQHAFTLLTYRDSALSQMVRDPEVLAKVVSLIRPPQVMPAEPGAKALRIPLDELLRRDPVAYTGIMKQFFDHTYDALIDRGDAVHMKFLTAFLPDEPGNPIYRDPKANDWILRFLGYVTTSRERATEPGFQKILQLLRLPEVQRMPAATGMVETLLLSPMLDDPAIDQALRTFLKSEPWSRHPRAAAWEKSFSRARMIRLDYHRINQREDYLKRAKFFRIADETRVRAWARSIPDAKPAAAVPTKRCAGFFGRLFGRSP